MRLLSIYLLCYFSCIKLYSQDPHFTQFTASPFTVNPSYAGVFNGVARVITNYRQQWKNLVEPYTTYAVAGDVKLGSHYSVNDQSPMNVGFQVIQDKSMAGAFKSTYGGMVVAYHVELDDQGRQSIGAGFSFNYGNRRIDLSDISFDRQFTSGGFNLSLPNGESAMQNMKSFFSIGAGILYRINDSETGTFLEFGLSGYNLNRPIQTIVQDPNQVIPVRFSSQLTFQKYLSNISILSIKACYQKQAEVGYMLAGVTFSRLFDANEDNMIGVGIWHRTTESIAPNLFIEYRNLCIGLSYDINYNTARKMLSPARSSEFSLQWRFGE